MAKHETTVVLKARDETRRALQSAERGMEQTERRADALAGAMSRILPALLAGVSIGAVVQFNQMLLEQQRNLQGMAAAADLTARRVAAYGVATRRVGVNTEQFADIVKDVNDKLGEFLATGGGGFKDFFERVPASLRMSAEEMGKLSGPQALIAVKRAMDAANLSGKEQVFILESLGNDASKLIPLLQDNGQALEKMADEAERTVLVLNKLQLSQLEDASRGIERAESQVSRFFSNVSAESAGIAEGVATFFEYAFLQFNASFFSPVEDQLKDLQEEAQTLAERLRVKEASGGVAFALVDLEGQLKEVNRQIALLEESLAEGGTVAAGLKGEINPELAMAERHVKRIAATRFDNMVKQAESFAKALEFASKEQDKIKRAVEGIAGIREERGAQGKKASVLGALTASSEARRQLERGNTTRAAELALQAAEELRQVEVQTGKNVTNAEAFIKNFEAVAKEALEKSQKAQESLKLVIDIGGGQSKEFSFTQEGVKQAGDFTTDRIKQAARKAGAR